MCFNETFNGILIDQRLSVSFPIQIDEKEGNALFVFIFNFALQYAMRNVPRKSGGTENECLAVTFPVFSK
jgi:hypothetical protein